MAYNLTNLTAAQDLGDLAVVANNFSNGVLFAGGTVAIFFITLILLSRNPNNDFANSLLVSSFVSFILSGMLAFGGYINILFPLGYLIILSLTGLLVWTSK